MSVTPVPKRKPKRAAKASTRANAIVTPAPCIVGIGASAGGFEAIRKFFHAMPSDSGVAFVIVQHLDPSHVSLAAEIYGKFTSMPVSEARNGEVIEANHVYTSPSDKDMEVLKGHLVLSPRKGRDHLHLPIDHFFRSLGDDCGVRAIGVVLSGTGSDGTQGLKAIAANGGVVLAQEPTTAQFDGMPRSAIAAGIANYVLAVENMPQVISGYARHPYVASAAEPAASEADSKETESLIKIIHARRGYDFSGYKRNTLLRRILRRMGLRGILVQADYVEMLKNNTDEVDALFRDLLIGVTEFFRDPEAWKALETDVITPLVAAKGRDEPIRIWIPGCSTGEEAYTMAMVVLDRVRRARKTCPVQIFATDTNNEALDVGRAGRYPVGISSHIPLARLRRYFVAGAAQQNYTVNEELRAAVVFGSQNLFSDPPFGRVDLISCRNVLIYLEPEVQKRVLNVFHFALRPDAYLFLGSAESNGGRDDLFKPISKKWRIFQREGATRIESLALIPKLAESRTGITPIAARPAPPLSHSAAIAQRLILDRFAPASVLVNANHEALYYCGPTEEFLSRPRGAPTQDLLVMVREGLRARLRAALKEAASNEATVVASGARMKHAGGFVPVEITVTPSKTVELGHSFLVVFRVDQKPILIPSDKSADRALVLHLEEELQVTRDDLQGTIERFETANENLRISNEEVVSTNEELRSLNEELESSKEELQSLNEELTTVNQQLETKMRELEVSNSDLQNLLVSSDIATICLDNNLRIKWFAPATQRLFNFIATDIGRPAGDMVSALGDAGLVLAVRSVLGASPVSDKEFQVENGRWYMRRILPYKSDDKQITGVIVTYTDITDSYLALQAANATRKDLSESMERTDKLRVLSAALATAEERERRTLAQDLHDDLGQMLAVVALKAATLQKQTLSAPLRHVVDDLAKAVDQANRKLRTMALQLNPPMLDQLGFVPALEWLVDEMNRIYKLKVDIDDDGTPKPMDPAVSATVFRAVRELLINVAKHARVTHAAVIAKRGEGNTLLVTVNDAGAGFSADAIGPASASGGFGLLSVRERLGYLGGEMTIQSTPGDGTSVVLKVPLLPPPKDDKTTGKGSLP